MHPFQQQHELTPLDLAASKAAAKTSLRQMLPPQAAAIAIRPQDLDLRPAADEDEERILANISEIELALDQPEQAIEAAAHVGDAVVEVDRRRRAQGAAAQAFALRQSVEGKEALGHDGEPEKLRDAKTPAGGGSLAKVCFGFLLWEERCHSAMSHFHVAIKVAPR